MRNEWRPVSRLPFRQVPGGRPLSLSPGEKCRLAGGRAAGRARPPEGPASGPPASHWRSAIGLEDGLDSGRSADEVCAGGCWRHGLELVCGRRLSLAGRTARDCTGLQCSAVQCSAVCARPAHNKQSPVAGLPLCRRTGTGANLAHSSASWPLSRRFLSNWPPAPLISRFFLPSQPEGRACKRIVKSANWKADWLGPFGPGPPTLPLGSSPWRAPSDQQGALAGHWRARAPRASGERARAERNAATDGQWWASSPSEQKLGHND